jgi:hypothetical protein
VENVEKLSTENVDKSLSLARFVDIVEKLSTENVEKSKDELSALIANIAGNITSYSRCGKCGKVIHRKC